MEEKNVNVNEIEEVETENEEVVNASDESGSMTKSALGYAVLGLAAYGTVKLVQSSVKLAKPAVKRVRTWFKDRKNKKDKDGIIDVEYSDVEDEHTDSKKEESKK